MDTFSIHTMTGKHSEELSITKAGNTAPEKRQQSNEEDTSMLEREGSNCSSELSVKQEPEEVLIKEEMVLENEGHFEEPVLANWIKKRWHEFGIELPQPLLHDENAVKQEASDECNRESANRASCSSLVSTTLPEPIKSNQELQEQTFQDCCTTQGTAESGQQQTFERPALPLTRKRLSEIIQQKMKSLPASVDILSENEKISDKTSEICDKESYTVLNPSLLRIKLLNILSNGKTDRRRIKDESAKDLAKEILSSDKQLNQNFAQSWSIEMLQKVNDILESRSFRFMNLSEEQRKANEKAEVLSRVKERRQREARLARETPEARERRLQSMRTYTALRRARETRHAREKRLYSLRLYRKRLREGKRNNMCLHTRINCKCDSSRKLPRTSV